MSDYKESCIKRKNVRAGIIEQRTVSNSKTKNVKHNWLTVYRNRIENKWCIWNEYKSEDLARKQMTKMISYWPMYIVERNIFDSYYSNYK